jgi:hypothetical protein
MTSATQMQNEPPFVSPKELALRWRCSRSSVDRVVERAGLTKCFLGDGRCGMVRFLLSEVEDFEESRKVQVKCGRRCHRENN